MRGWLIQLPPFLSRYRRGEKPCQPMNTIAASATKPSNWFSTSPNMSRPNRVARNAAVTSWSISWHRSSPEQPGRVSLLRNPGKQGPYLKQVPRVPAHRDIRRGGQRTECSQKDDSSPPDLTQTLCGCFQFSCRVQDVRTQAQEPFACVCTNARL